MSAGSDENPNPRAARGLFELIVAHRKLLLIVFVACGACGYLLSALMHRAYRADALVVPVQAPNSSLTSGLSSLVAAGAFSALGLAPAADKNEALETLQSRTLIQQFIVERHLMPIICKSEAFDCQSPSSDGPLADEHNMNDAVQLFQDNLLGVNEDTVSGAIHVTLVWYDRALAAEWVNGLIALTNQHMQENARDLAAKRVQFLQREYTRTDVVTIQSTISTLLQAEFSRSLDAGTRPEFALRVVDPAAQPDDRYPVRPRKAVIGAASGVVGALLALLYVWLRRRRTGR